MSRRPRSRRSWSTPLVVTALAALAGVSVSACSGEAGREPSVAGLSSASVVVVAPTPSGEAPSPTGSSSAKVELPAPTPHEVRLVSYELTGLEARVAAASLEVAGPRIEACVVAAAPQSFAGWLTVRADVKPGGALAGLVAEGLGPTLGGCVEKALAPVVLEGLVRPGAKLALHASVRPRASASDARATPLPALGEHEALLRVDGGLCRGRTDHECPPRKICQAPTQRDVLCPEAHGLPPALDWARADKRLRLAIGGGKTGQGPESVELGREGDACASRRSVGDGVDPLAPKVSEDLPIVCADFDAVWALAQKRLGAARPKSQAGRTHVISRTVAFTTRRPGLAPPLVDLRLWLGESSADEAFAEVARAATKLGAARAKVGLVRLE
jgi:hypothetical protein